MPETTIWNRSDIPSFMVLVRQGTSDWNTVEAAVGEDEYGLADVEMHSDKLVFDVGAHIGSVGLWCQKRGASVVFIEPVPDNVEMIRANCQLNGMSAEVLQAAAGEAHGTTNVRYGFTGNETAIHHAFIGNTGLAFEPGAVEDLRYKECDVPTVSLESLINVYGVPDVIKIDCEGGEWFWLAEDCIRFIPLIVGEWHPMRWLDRGYSLTDLRDMLEPTHRLTISGPENGPGGFRAELR